ncbi:MAG: FliO/MopB family protein [Nitrospina sp.]|jgi:flagellar protein FliO/FliZ|nr:FliO/MopB family protein [Nitrospina sp.]MBT5631800.1 FliO/MopB family protein [Nitrospina sp.]
MKHVLRIKLLVGIVLFSLTTMAGASGKWDSLNPLKNVVTSKVDHGFIVRFEFEKPVDDYKEPVFFDKSVQIDFPSAFIKPAKKYFPADSFSTTKIFAAQFDENTLRVRFLKKDKSIDLRDRFHIARQGRFLIVRLDEGESVPVIAEKIKEVEPANHDLMTEDELSIFLARASEKIRALDQKKVPVSTEVIETSKSVEVLKTEEVEKAPNIKVTRAGMGVEPIVEQIRKVAQQNSKPDKETGAQKGKEKQSSDKRNKGFSLQDSRPTGKPIELIPSGLKMVSMLSVVLGIMFLLFFGFKKYVLKNTMFGGGEKLINVLGTGFLGPKKNIVLVEVADEVLVLGMSQNNISLLTNITDPEKIEEIKSRGGKGGSGLNWNMGSIQSEVAGTSESKTTGQFSNFMKKFSGPEPVNKNKSVADVTAQIKQQMGRFKSARA